jgi:hypothetical protein
MHSFFECAPPAKEAIGQPKGNAEFPALTAKEDADFFRNAEGSEVFKEVCGRIQSPRNQPSAN